VVELGNGVRSFPFLVLCHHTRFGDLIGAIVFPAGQELFLRCFYCFSLTLSTPPPNNLPSFLPPSFSVVGELVVFF